MGYRPKRLHSAFILASLSTILSFLGVNKAVSAETKTAPNVVLILADDLGYADLGCQGCTDIPTPHIDSLAKNGVRFSNGYVSCPVCSPTRAGLMTGRYQQRFGHELNPAGSPKEAEAYFGLPLTEKTLANHLKDAGYATGLVGKWHLGLAKEYFPQKRGFDEFFGFLHGAHPYLYGSKARKVEVFRDTTVVEEKEYLTDALAREAVSFIDRHQKEPFFLYLAFNAVHVPLEATPKYLERFPGIQDRNRRSLAAMLSATDDAVGAVLAKLRTSGLVESTLIVFLSDNGGDTPKNTSRNDPLRGTKHDVLEGGIRIPFMVQWKGHLPEGKVYDHPVIALDILPTTLAAVGSKPPSGAKLDGVNLLPYLTGKNAQAPHEALFWRLGRQWAIRKGNWKLLKMAKEPELFNLSEDIGERKDLASQKPEVVKELTAAWQAWNSQLVKPLWRGPDYLPNPNPNP